MSDYSAIDISAQDGSPIYLFLFSYEGTEYRYTSRPEGVNSTLGYDWVYANIELGKIGSSEDINKDSLDIKFDIDDVFASQFLTERQDLITSATVFRGYENNPADDWNIFWKGKVGNSSVRGNSIELECESVFSSMRRPGIRGKMSKLCRHVHYGRGCNLDPNASGVDALYIEDIVSDVSEDQLTLTINDAALQADGFYRSGMVMAGDGVFRYIKSHNGTSITVYHPHVGFISSDSVRLYRGCNRTTTSCIEQNNLNNYGGFPYTPDVNPLGGTRLQ